MSDDFDLDQALVDVDPPSRVGWRNRALGMPVADAMSLAPSSGQVTFKLPIIALQRLREHCVRHDTSAADYSRAAVAAALERDGWTPEELAWLRR